MPRQGIPVRAIKKRAANLARKNRLTEARELYRDICQYNPRDSSSLIELSTLNRKLGAFPDAEQCARAALAQQPELAPALTALGAALQCQGRLEEATASYQQAIRLASGCAETHYLLANSLREQGLIDAAITAYERTLDIDPDHVESLNNLSVLLTTQGKIQLAGEHLRHSLKLRPNSPQMLINLARTCLHSGDAEEAQKMLRRVITQNPGMVDPHSQLLQVLNYLPSENPQGVFAEHVRWAEAHTCTMPRPTSYRNNRDPHRKLRIGYVSPDLWEHSVARFLEPVLAHHDQTRFEIICYADVRQPDATTRRLESLSSRFRFVNRLSDEQLATLIQNDDIDILVDLAGHTAHNRLLVFARKPAPVQLSWLGYPNTTGLKAIDYRLTDRWADPPGTTEQLHTETLQRMPDSFLCYGPPEDAPPVSPPPSHATGIITFGSFNNLAKTTPQVIEVWSRILHSVPGFRLALKSRATSDTGTRNRLLGLFSGYGIHPERILLMEPVQSTRDHLEKYAQIDIGLDPFPYNGTTTSCEALWMGVPVVTVAGRVHAARVGVSLLSQLGLEDLVAEDTEAYVEISVALATDKARLSLLRKSLRQSMESAPLCDATSFTNSLETIYRKIWADWCSNGTGRQANAP